MEKAENCRNMFRCFLQHKASQSRFSKRIRAKNEAAAAESERMLTFLPVLLRLACIRFPNKEEDEQMAEEKRAADAIRRFEARQEDDEQMVETRRAADEIISGEVLSSDHIGKFHDILRSQSECESQEVLLM